MNHHGDTLDVLSKYIETQKTLLARANEDIERLQRLRAQAMAEPRKFVDQNGLQHSRALVYPRQPAKSQGAPLSSLQLLVKDARECILEPLGLGFGVGAGSGALSESLVEENEDSLSGVMTSGVTENDIIGTRRSGLRVTIPSRSQLRTRLANEASATTNAANTPTTRSSGEPMSTAPWHLTPASSDPSPTTPSFPPTPTSETANAIPETQTKIKITRPKNLANVVSTSVSAPARTRVRQATSAAMDIDAEPRALIQPPLTIKLGKRGRAPSASPAPALASQAPGAELTVSNKGKGRDKKKPETYKQAWSVSEQHLLEKLLEDIPEGSKNRLDSPFSKLKELAKRMIAFMQQPNEIVDPKFFIGLIDNEGFV
ncbi:hypothetical protein HWV62_14246 [Athelia sp. TMB]|nr:hypothetical protein HWV62_14246 [Athelia sp. TMB]